MDISWLQLVLIVLAVFRITRLIVYDQITAFIRAPFMEEYEEEMEGGETEVYLIPRSKGIRGWIGELLSCYWCTGVWVAIAVFILWKFNPNIAEPVILIFAFAGGAAIIETIIQRILSD
ncbi:DUF1360 domain-containing protein [Lederbergia graminis]|uniref:DUF1360 domain-containing protein n=1 Tax=Lederbergia graminis TaxID=735518 RepID=A0ABW0LHL0_9BACI